MTAVVTAGAVLALGLGSLSIPDVVRADGFNPMSAMNPSKWFGGNDRGGRRYYDDDYYGGPGRYGYGGYPGYGYGGYPGYGGWGGYPGYGWGGPGYGGYGPGYGNAPAAPEREIR